jgi:hypothetical protein
VVDYGTTASYSSGTLTNASMVLSHSQSLINLTASTTYHYRVRSTDAAGNPAVSGDYVFITEDPPDTTPPVIGSVSSTGITSSSATISWTTNETADSQVDYGTTTTYNGGTLSNNSRATSHSHSLSNLAASTTYHYRVKSTDVAGNQGVSADYEFTTAESSGPSLTISSIVISNITDKSATISWTTDRPADSEVDYWVAGSAMKKSARRGFVTEHTLVLTRLKKLTKYYFHIVSVDEAGNQGISFDADFSTTDGVIIDLVMPRFSAGQNVLGENTMAGLGFTDLDAQPTTITFTATDDSGNLTSAADINNPVSSDLDSKAQLPIIDSQLFGAGLSNSKSNGWIKIESDTANAHGFFMVFDKDLNFMDGANFEDTKLADFAFTDVRTDGYNKISIINNNSNAATVVFNLIRENGAVRSSQSRVIPKMGSLTADLFGDIFEGTLPDAADYVRVKSSEGVQSFELMRQKEGDIAALTGQDMSAGSAVLYSPQYAVGGYIRTTMSVINLDSVPGTVTFRFMDENGVQQGSTRTLPIAPNGKLCIEDQAFFLTPDSKTLVAGYVEIRSSGVRITGSTVFGDSKQLSSLTALALVSDPQTSLLFSQIASNDVYYTGLAFLNPSLIDAHINIKAYDRDGSLIGSKNETLKAGQRVSRTITQYISEIIGKNQTGGYVLVTSDSPIASYALFGTTNSSLMSAITPLVIQ